MFVVLLVVGVGGASVIKVSWLSIGWLVGD